MPGKYTDKRRKEQSERNRRLGIKPPTWNKGKTKETDDRIKRNGESISRSATGNPKFSRKGKENAMFGKGDLLKGKKNGMFGKGNLLRGDKNGMFGKKHSKEALRKILEGLKKASKQSPNNLEQMMIRHFERGWLKELGIEFVGNRKFWVGDKNPDFIVKGTRKLIEIYGNYWHTKEEEKERVKYFEDRGYQCLVLWENEIYDSWNMVVEKFWKFMARKTILVISPHPDDETLACGGTLYKLAKEGYRIIAVCLTHSDQAYSSEDEKKQIHKVTFERFKKACFILGIKEVVDLTVGNSQFKDMYLQDCRGDLMVKLIEVVRKYAPLFVFTTNTADFHCDHRTSAEILREVVYQATRIGVLGGQEKINEPYLWFGEVDLENLTKIRSDIFVELDEEALQVYESFVSEHPDNSKSMFSSQHGRDWIYSVARIRGMHNGCQYAEIFEKGNFKAMITLEQLLEQRGKDA
jgi:LmbE family N-acetylglucosaminyl deacetylase